MSTNYYVIDTGAQVNGHPVILHIGKRSVGWRFLFRAYPRYGLTSFKAWQVYLTDKHLEIEGNTYPLDKQKFFEMVRDSMELKSNNVPEGGQGEIKLDPEGYELTEQEFS